MLQSWVTNLQGRPVGLFRDFLFLVLVFPSCQLLQHQNWDIWGKKKKKKNLKRTNWMSLPGSWGPQPVCLLSPPYGEVFLFMFDVSYLGILVLLSRRNREKYVYSTSPEAEVFRLCFKCSCICFLLWLLGLGSYLRRPPSRQSH